MNSMTIDAIDTHTGGEATRVITSFMKLEGKTILEKREFFKKNFDFIRRALMLEPRGHRDMFGSIITEACDKRADFGIIFMDCDGYLDMCGHGTIGTVTAIVITGLVDAKSDFIIETVAGLIKARANIENGKVKSVGFENVESFVYEKDVKVEVSGFGEIIADIAFGGNFFAIVDAKKIGLDINLSNADKIRKVGLEIKKAINEKVKIDDKQIDLVEFSEKRGENHYRNVVVFGNGQIDRSACGTGTCAKLAQLHSRKELAVGEKIINDSIVGTKFIGEILKETNKGIICRITGKANITGFNKFMIDEDDEIKYGFLI